MPIMRTGAANGNSGTDGITFDMLVIVMICVEKCESSIKIWAPLCVITIAKLGLLVLFA